MDRPTEITESGSADQSTSLLATITRELFSAAIGVLGVYLSAKLVKRVLDPSSEVRERNRQRRDEIVTRLCRTGVPRQSLRSLSPCEETLIHELIFPEDISTTLDSIGGLRHTKQTLRELIIYPMVYPEVYASSTSSLLSPPKGILLYGPPGTGKTLLAKALAKESGANFMALSPSTLLAKYVGETEQLVQAVFSLARRVQPTIIFIDEIDGLFRERSSSEHEVHNNLKAEFMQLWDGLTTDDRYNRVIVLGATNRPFDVDPAILRRMPRPFEVALPNSEERVDILHKVLDGVELHQPFDYRAVANATEGYSGSDLKELCRAAMMEPLREGVRSVQQDRRRERRSSSNSSTAAATGAQELVYSTDHRASSPSRAARLRPLTVGDILMSRRTVRRTQEESAEYEVRSQPARATAADAISGVNHEAMQAAMIRMLQMMQAGSSAA